MKKIIFGLSLSVFLLTACNSTLSLEEQSIEVTQKLKNHTLDILPNGDYVDISNGGRSDKVYFKIQGKNKIDYVNDIDYAEFHYLEEGESYLEVVERRKGYEYYIFHINLQK